MLAMEKPAEIADSILFRCSTGIVRSRTCSCSCCGWGGEGRGMSPISLPLMEFTSRSIGLEPYIHLYFS